MIRPPSSGSSTMTTPAPTPAPVLYLGLRPVDPFGQKVMDFVERLLKSGQCTKAQCDQLIKWYGQLNIGPDAYIDLTALMIRIVAPMGIHEADREVQTMVEDALPKGLNLKDWLIQFKKFSLEAKSAEETMQKISGMYEAQLQQRHAQAQESVQNGNTTLQEMHVEVIETNDALRGFLVEARQEMAARTERVNTAVVTLNGFNPQIDRINTGIEGLKNQKQRFLLE